jgi:hypothetical protein
MRDRALGFFGEQGKSSRWARLQRISFFVDQKITAQVSKELAIRDLSDIADLRRSESFNRYFIRRLQQKHDATRKSFEDDPPEVTDKDEREVLRRLMKAYRELLGMMDADEASIRSQLR